MPVIEAHRRRRRAASPSTHRSSRSPATALDAGATLRQRRHRLPRTSPEMAALVAERGVDCCLMHMLGEPRTMQVDPRYDDVVSDVKAFLEERLAFAVGRGRRRGAHPARPRDRLRQDDRRTTSSCCAASTSSSALGRPAGGRHLAQVVPRPASPAATSRRAGGAAPSPANVLALRARRARVPRPRRGRHPRCARRGDCYVGRAMDPDRRRRLRRRRPDRRRRGARRPRGRRHDRDRRPVALHPPRRHGRGARDRPAARASTSASTSASPTPWSRTASRTPSTTARSAR